MPSSTRMPAAAPSPSAPRRTGSGASCPPSRQQGAGLPGRDHAAGDQHAGTAEGVVRTGLGQLDRLTDGRRQPGETR